MNTDQIRLSILFQYYRAMFDGQRGSLEQNLALKDIPYEIINANLVWLLDKQLINGQKRYADDGRVHVIPIDITANGMDIIEKILNQSLTELDQNISSEIKKENTLMEKLDKLSEICTKIQPVFEIVVKIAGMIFSNLK